MERHLFDADHDAFRETARAFCEKEIVPHHESWEEAGIVPRELWIAAGDAGLLGFMVPEQYGGGGALDFRFNAVVIEEVTKARASGPGFTIHADVVSGYLLDYASEEQKARWLPKFCTGETITAIAMTEPGAGSDLQGIQTTAIRDGDDYILNGQKTFISNGILADPVSYTHLTLPTN